MGLLDALRKKDETERVNPQVQYNVNSEIDNSELVKEQEERRALLEDNTTPDLDPIFESEDVRLKAYMITGKKFNNRYDNLRNPKGITTYIHSEWEQEMIYNQEQTLLHCARFGARCKDYTTNLQARIDVIYDLMSAKDGFARKMAATTIKSINMEKHDRSNFNAKNINEKVEDMAGMY